MHAGPALANMAEQQGHAGGGGEGAAAQQAPGLQPRDGAPSAGAAAAPVAGQRPPDRGPFEGALHTFAMFYAAAMNHFFMSFGVLFLIQAFQASRVLRSQDADSQGSDEGVSGLLEAARLLLGNFAMPFSETAAAAAFPAEVGIKVLGFWVPTLLGGTIISTAMMGHLSLKFRRPVCVLVYVILTVVQLAWQVELGKVLRVFAGAEDLADIVELGRNERMQSVQYAMFEAPYENFVTMYNELQCSATLPSGVDEQVRLECTTEGMESKVMQFVVGEFCRARKPAGLEQVEEFGKRVEACSTQGREANLLPARMRPREVVFCRCRSAVYDWLRFVSKWIMLIWCGELVGVCIVLYFAVEQNLAKMEPTQRREVVGFAVVGLAILIGRVTIFADYFDEAAMAEL